MIEKTSTSFIAAWQAGQVCLHPTDTLPGLTVDPRNDQAVEALRRYKQRNNLRTFISLVPSLEAAELYWQPLPGNWRETLAKLWPAPLSVVWQASKQAPPSLVGEDGTIAFRCPAFSGHRRWMQEVLEAISSPLPTTSFNRAAQPPCASWEEAAAKAAAEGFYVPAHRGIDTEASQPSTLIQLRKDGSFTILRQGAFKVSMIHESK